MIWLSIITVNLNNQAGLKKTMTSVFAQTFRNKEYIIIDGASTDDSPQLISKHSQHLKYWVSEKDQGIYQAMNKGIVQAQGKYLLFLNSGDTLSHSNILSELFNRTSDNNADIFYTDAYFIDESKKKAWLKHYPKTLNDSFFISSSLCHQSMLIDKRVLESLGGYLENYSLSSDWIFSFIAFKKGYSFQKVENLTLSHYLLNGASANYQQSKDQRLDFIQHNYPEYLQEYLWHIRKRSISERIYLRYRNFIKNLNDRQQKITYQNYLKSLSYTIEPKKQQK